MRRMIEYIAQYLHERDGIAEDAEVDVTIERIDQAFDLGPSVRSWAMIKREVGQDRMSNPAPIVRHVLGLIGGWPERLKSMNQTEIMLDVHRPQAPVCSICTMHIASRMILERVEDPRNALKALALEPVLKMNNIISLQGTPLSLQQFETALDSPTMSNQNGPLLLNLRGCELTTDHVKAMLGSPVIRRLELLDVADNAIDAEGIALLVRWVRRRRTMRAMRLVGNPGLEGRDERQIARAYDNQNLLLVDIGGTGHHSLINEPTRQITFAGLQADYM